MAANCMLLSNCMMPLTTKTPACEGDWGKSHVLGVRCDARVETNKRKSSKLFSICIFSGILVLFLHTFLIIKLSNVNILTVFD